MRPRLKANNTMCLLSTKTLFLHFPWKILKPRNKKLSSCKWTSSHVRFVSLFILFWLCDPHDNTTKKQVYDCKYNTTYFCQRYGDQICKWNGNSLLISLQLFIFIINVIHAKHKYEVNFMITFHIITTAW